MKRIYLSFAQMAFLLLGSLYFAGCERAPYSLEFSVQPTDVVSMVAMRSFTVALKDKNGNRTNISQDVTIWIADNPSGGKLYGTTTVKSVNGIAEFSDLRINKAGGGYTFVVWSKGAETQRSEPFQVKVGPPAQVVFATQPKETVSLEKINPIEVRIEDLGGNHVTNATNLVKMELVSGPGTLMGTKEIEAFQGIATFDDLSIDLIKNDYSLRASSPGLTSALSDAFALVPGPVAQIVFMNDVQTTTSEVAIENLTLVLKDLSGNTTTSSDSIQISLKDNSAGGVLEGNLILNAINGVATFTNVSIAKAGQGYTLSGASGEFSVTSNPFEIVPGPPKKLFVDQQPSNVVSEKPIQPSVRVLVQDNAGNLVTASSNQVMLELKNNPSGGILLGGESAPASQGIATFANLSVDKVGLGYTLEATSEGLSSVATSGFDVSYGVPARLVFDAQPLNGVSEQSLDEIRVRILDNAGNWVEDATNEVTLSIAFNPGQGTLLGGDAVVAEDGSASFDGLSIEKAGVGYTLSATSSGLVSVTSNPFSIVHGPPAKLYFATQPPAKTLVNFPISAVTVEVRDNADNIVLSSQDDVTMALEQSEVSAANLLDGTKVSSVEQGSTKFADLLVNRKGDDYRLVASVNGLPSIKSNAFEILELAYWPSRCELSTGDIDTYSDITPDERFEEAEGVVTDLCTNLMWEQNVTDEPLSLEEGLAHCASLELGEYDDYRLPTRTELFSIVDFSQGAYLASPTPAINQKFFPNTPTPFGVSFWTNSTVSGVSDFFWGIDFYEGQVVELASAGEAKNLVRCVRTAARPETAQEHLSGDSQSLTDNYTRLIWQNTLSFEGEIGTLFADAQSVCQQLGSGFRLPSIKELATLVDLRTPQVDSVPTLFQPFLVPYASDPTILEFPFWSDSLIAGVSDAWGVNFSNGRVEILATENSVNLVRCVKPKPLEE